MESQDGPTGTEAGTEAREPYPVEQCSWWDLKNLDDDAFDAMALCSSDPFYDRDMIVAAFQSDNVDVLVCVSPEMQIVGWVMFSRLRAVTTIWHVAVLPELRRLRIGVNLVHAVGRLAVGEQRTVTTRVRDDDLPGQLLMKAAGLRCVNIARTAVDAFYEFTSSHAAAIEADEPTRAELRDAEIA